MKELDLAVLERDLQEHGLARADIGTVVHVHPGGEAYEVEFVLAFGETVAVLTLAAAIVRPGGGSDRLGRGIEDYPEGEYGPSRLVFGITHSGRPLHIQCSFPGRRPIEIITMYQPEAGSTLERAEDFVALARQLLRGEGAEPAH